MNDVSPGSTLVLGLGNPLMTDDGVGLAALARLESQYAMDPGVHLVDGGTWGMNLLPMIEDTRRLVLLDAIRSGALPGTLVVLERDQLPRYFALKLSPHQIDLREVLALAELRGTLPEETVAIGLEPEDVEMGTVLTSRLGGRVDALVDAAVERLRAMGHRVEPVPPQAA
jgi:hydrogenase maturation protease